MNNLRFLVLFSLLHLAILVPAQNFKIIKETDDYILKECDSAYYFSHGIKNKGIADLDSTKIHKENRVLKLPLDNGKYIEFCDSFITQYSPYNIDYTYYGIDKYLGYYYVEESRFKKYKKYWIDKRTGEIVMEDIFPLWSPKYQYYAYVQVVLFGDNGYIVFAKHKSKRHIKINYFGECPLELKWIDDRHFEFNTNQYPDEGCRNHLMKYYLVEIKQ